MHPLIRLLTFVATVFGFVAVLASSSQAAQPKVDIPQDLEPWKKWVLYDNGQRQCPFLYNQAQYLCHFIGHLSLDATDHDIHFEQSIKVYNEGWVNLPGNNDYWPEEVMHNNKNLSVRQRGNIPSIHLTPGQYLIKGVIRWHEIPRILPIPQTTGLIALRINNARVSPTTLESPGQLLLGKAINSTSETPENALTVKVFRLITDTIPMTVTTQVHVDVSGEEREISLGQFLLQDFTPQTFNSPLPARIENNGNLRIQLKPGSWQITLVARSQGQPENLGYKNQSTDWPNEEIWAFAARAALRTVEITGAPSIDPQQTQLPASWRSLPAYLMTPSTRLEIIESYRGNPNPSNSELSLKKELWLDFSGDYFTVRDTITGAMHDTWRIDADPAYQLGSVTLNGDPQLVTQREGHNSAGVEVRPRSINLVALSRIARVSELPTNGWQQDFTSVQTNLYLPPGWSLLSSHGADTISGSWLHRWNLWDIFLVLIISVALGRGTRWYLGVLAFTTLMLIYHRTGAPVFIWLNLAICLGLMNVVTGQFRRWLRYYTLFGFFILTLLMLPFGIQQARQVFYPQLEHPYINLSAGNSTRERSMANEPEMEMDMAASGSSISDILIEESIALPRNTLRKMKKMAAPRQMLDQAYDPEQHVQTGPGQPNWHWNQARLYWSGPVKPSETTRIVLASPLINRIGHFLALVIPLLLGVLLLKHLGLPALPKLRTKGTGSAATALLLMFMLFPSDAPQASVIIDQSLLDELHKRLTQAPDCLPACASIEKVNVSIDDKQLLIHMRVHSNEFVAITLPAKRGDWWPTSVSVNQQQATMMQNANGQLMVALPKGTHNIELQGSVSDQQNISLAFAMSIHNLTDSVQDWELTGAPRQRQTSANLQLKRTGNLDKAQIKILTPEVVPAFVTVHRHLLLGLEWSVETQVRRVAPSLGVISLRIPLLPGEAPLSGTVNKNTMQVDLAPNQQMYSWKSVLDINSPLTLIAATGNHPWVETWSLDSSPVWHTEVTGIATVKLHANQNLPMWSPQPGEEITLNISKPPAISGNSITITRAHLTHNIGTRAQNVQLQLGIKTNQGGHYNLTIPEFSTLTSVSIDGRDQPLNHIQGVIRIPLHPGTQNVSLAWQEQTSKPTHIRTANIHLEHPATNLAITVNLPRNRWPLMVGGPAMGPAILLWGILTVVLILALGLSRTKLTPLKSYEWILLSLGIGTFNIYLLGLIAAWFIIISKRGSIEKLPGDSTFNLMQVALFIFSAATLALMLSAVPYGLLAEPNMMIAGNGSSSHVLNWYSDRTEGAFPSAWVISLPMWAYRVAMLLWSLWLAFALMRWLPWAWQQLGKQKMWLHQTLPNKPERKQATAEKLDLDLPLDQ